MQTGLSALLFCTLWRAIAGEIHNVSEMTHGRSLRFSRQRQDITRVRLLFDQISIVAGLIEEFANISQESISEFWWNSMTCGFCFNQEMRAIDARPRPAFAHSRPYRQTTIGRLQSHHPRNSSLNFARNAFFFKNA